jgi:hypothetical protein
VLVMSLNVLNSVGHHVHVGEVISSSRSGLICLFIFGPDAVEVRSMIVPGNVSNHDHAYAVRSSY